MIKLTFTPNEEMKEYYPDKIEVTAEEEGHIHPYIVAFRSFLRSVGFAHETIDKYVEDINEL